MFLAKIPLGENKSVNSKVYQLLMLNLLNSLSHKRLEVVLLQKKKKVDILRKLYLYFLHSK